MENIKKSMKYTSASVEYSSIAFYSYIKRTGLFLYRNTMKIGKVVSISNTNIFRKKRKCSKDDKNIYIERFDSLEKILEELNKKLDSLEKLNPFPMTDQKSEADDSLEKILEELNKKLDSLEKLNPFPMTDQKSEADKKIKQVNGSKKMLLQAIFHENKLLHNKN